MKAKRIVRILILSVCLLTVAVVISAGAGWLSIFDYPISFGNGYKYFDGQISGNGFNAMFVKDYGVNNRYIVIMEVQKSYQDIQWPCKDGKYYIINKPDSIVTGPLTLNEFRKECYKKGIPYRIQYNTKIPEYCPLNFLCQ